MKKRGRKQQDFAFTEYFANRIYEERRKQQCSTKKSCGLLVDREYMSPNGSVGPLRIPANRLQLRVDVLLEHANERGEKLTIKDATREALHATLKQYGKEYLTDDLLQNALRLLRRYRKNLHVK